MAQSGTLTARQAAFVTAFLGNPTVEAAARAAGVSIRTARRWVQLQAIRAALLEAQRQALALASRQAVRAMGAALATLEAIHSDAENTPAARVAAARAILDAGPRLLDLTDLEARLTALEQGK